MSEFTEQAQATAAQYYSQVADIQKRNTRWTSSTSSLAKEAADLGTKTGRQPVNKPTAISQQADDGGNREDTGRGIGYKLLKKAGWREGRGLGANEQGTVSPVAAWEQAGRAGIGTLRPKSTDPKKQEEEKRGSAAQQQMKRKANSEQHKAPKREWERIAVEESLDTKVKRVRQVMQAEADAAAGREIQQYMFRAFAEPDASTVSNPLLRRSSSTRATNPLL